MFRALTCLFSLLYSQIEVYNKVRRRAELGLGGDKWQGEVSVCVVCMYVLFVLCPCHVLCVLCVLCVLTCLFSLLYSQMYVLHERKLKGGRVLGGDESGRPGECMYMYFVYIVCYVLAVCCVCFVH